MPGPLASPEMMFTEGAPPRRLWLLEVGVVGVRASDVLWLSGRDEGARPVEDKTRTVLTHTPTYFNNHIIVFACSGSKTTSDTCDDQYLNACQTILDNNQFSSISCVSREIHHDEHQIYLMFACVTCDKQLKQVSKVSSLISTLY